MLEFFILSFVSLLSAASCYVTFDKNLHNKWFYIPLGLLLAISSNLIWYTSAKYMSDEKKIYIFSLMWDFIVCFIYVFFPLLMFKIKVDKLCYLGLIFMIIGLILVKIRN